MVVTAIIGITFLTLYFYVGHRLWEHMFAVENDPGCILNREHAKGEVPEWVHHVFLVVWLPLLLVAYAATVASPRTNV